MTQVNDTLRTLVLDRELPHPPEKVWRALTEGPLLKEWLMSTDFEPTVGHTFTFQAEPNPHWDGIVRSEVLVVEPPSRLSYRWDALGLLSVVTWTLTPTPEGTGLRMEQAGFTPEQNLAFAGAKAGWSGMLDTLATVLERLEQPN